MSFWPVPAPNASYMHYDSSNAIAKETPESRTFLYTFLVLEHITCDQYCIWILVNAIKNRLSMAKFGRLLM